MAKCALRKHVLHCIVSYSPAAFARVRDLETLLLSHHPSLRVSEYIEAISTYSHTRVHKLNVHLHIVVVVVVVVVVVAVAADCSNAP